MCKSNGESVDHLLLHCRIAVELWTLVFALFGVHSIMPKTVVELLACWQGKFGLHHNSFTRKAVPHCLMWSIWQERNNLSFEDTERTG